MQLKRKVGRFLMWIHGGIKQDDLDREVSEQAVRITERAKNRGEPPERVRSLEMSLSMMSREIRREANSGRGGTGRRDR